MAVWVPVGSDLLGAKHLAGPNGAFEPQRVHNFELLIEIPGGDGQILMKSVETAFGVSHSSEPLMLPYMNETIFIAGRPAYAPGMVVFRDMVDKPIYSALEDWYKKIYDPLTSFIGFAYEYKSMANLTLYDVQGGRSREWTLYGIWPQDINTDGPTYMSGEMFRINVSFQYDKAVPLFV